MGPPLNLLSFERRQTSSDNKAVVFFDFLIDGRSLSEHVAEAIGLVTPFAGGWPLWIMDAYAESLVSGLSTQMPTGRIALYVCDFCGDVDCGTVVTRVTIQGNRVKWSEFRHEVTYGTAEDGDESSFDLRQQSFEFDKHQYTEAIRSARTQVAEIATA